MSSFKTKNNLSKDALFPESRRLNYSIVMALIFFEIIFNAFFFREVRSTGFIGGMTISIYIAFLNVIIGFFVVAGVTTAAFVGFNTYKNYDFSKNKLEIKNSLLTDNLDLDYVEFLIRDKFLLGKKNETVYIINYDDN